MADIVYDMHDGGDGKGTLFKGKKFFFLMRVPFRDKWMSDVKANGGEIVKLEKQADVIIADHAKKDPPVESVSWKFIQDSVKEGSLKDVTAYKKFISQPASQQQPKSRRTPFTTEDDRILAEWVTEAERLGYVTKGNVLYQELERMNNRHTAQSWRDRWVKYVSFQPRPPPRVHSQRNSTGDQPAASQKSSPNQISGLQPSISNEREPSSRTSIAVDERAFSQTPQVLEAPASSSRPTSAGDSKARLDTRKKRSHPKISTGESKFTNEEIDLLFEEAYYIMNLDEDRAIDAWITWANKFPNHTAQEWRNCFVELVAPSLQEKAKKNHKRASSHSEAKEVSAITPRKGQLQNESPYGSDLNLPVSNHESASEHSRPSRMAEKVFKRKLTILANAQAREAVLTASICGRSVSLYKIWRIVQSEELGGFTGVNEKRLWPVVARKLNFNDFQHKKAANELELWYRDILLILDDAHEEFESLPEEEMIQIQLNHSTSEREDSTEDSGPLQMSRKSNDAQSPRKRRRIDESKVVTHEIPGTPESVTDDSPVRRSVHSAQQREDVSQTAVEDVEKESESELEVRPFRKISLSAISTSSVADQVIAEPETQDFHFSVEQHDDLETEPSVPASRPKTYTKSPNSTAHKKITEGSSTRGRAETQTETQRAADLNSFIEHYISLGYDPRHVIEALEATTMDTGDAGFVMESLQAGNGVPRDIQGVWTSSDDEAAEDKDHPKFGDAVEKHGIDRVGLRRRFLADQRAAREQLSRSEVDM